MNKIRNNAGHSQGKPERSEARKISFSRVYSFSAAHRLHSAVLTDEENAGIYEKCNNLNGHGHDYQIEVTVCGEPNPLTGMIIPMPQLDERVKDLTDRLDHKHLNFEIDYFREHHSTGEVIIQYLWNELDKLIPGKLLYHICLWETNNNYFEIGRDN